MAIWRIPALLITLLWTAACVPVSAGEGSGEGASVSVSRPILIAHRGASGERPEHTLAAYALAIELGADYIEPDLVLTKDGVLVARHENEISETTDVADRPEYADRKTTKTIDGDEFTGWFTEDFTLAELKTLRAKERLPQLRPANTTYDGQFEVPTFVEILELLRKHEEATGERIGVYPETKHPSYFASIGLPHEDPLLAALAEYGYTKASDPVFIQSFEVGNLRALSGKTDLRLIQLMAYYAGPADLPEQSYSEMLSDAGLADIATYADGIGVAKMLVRGRDENDAMGADTGLVARAHAVGLKVHIWTIRAENMFLPSDLRDGDDPAVKGDMAAEIDLFLETGIDGYFTDHSREAAATRD